MSRQPPEARKCKETDPPKNLEKEPVLPHLDLNSVTLILDFPTIEL